MECKLIIISIIVCLFYKKRLNFCYKYVELEEIYIVYFFKKSVSSFV